MVVEPAPLLFGPEILGWPTVFVGGVGVVFSAMLGLFGLRIAAKTQLPSAPRVFARGVVGVTSVFAFLASATIVLFGLNCVNKVLSRSTGVWIVLVGVSLLCLAVEFGIGGALYARARPTFATRALSVVSFIVVPVLALLGVGVLIVGVLELVHSGR